MIQRDELVSALTSVLEDAGTTLAAVQDAAAGHGLMFPLDPNGILNPGKIFDCE